MGIRSYRDLGVWQAGLQLVEATYRLTERFPDSQRYGLTSQIQRAAVSVPSNIAEGHARASRKEFLQFLSISLGSLAELETQLFIAQRVSYLSQSELDGLLRQTEELGRMIRGLQKALRAKDARSKQ